MVPEPDVAVVIATRERETRLSFALEALARQTLDSERFEVVVVRGAGAGGALAEAPDGLRVRFVDHRGNPGPGAQRNTGLRHVTAPLVAFTDDDCRPAPDWLERLLEAHDGPDVLVQGRTEPDPDEAHLLIGLARSINIDRPSDWYETCNILYPTEALRRLDGFDEQFRFSAEDADLGLRARADGMRRRYEHRALVWHAVVPTPIPRAISAALARDSTPLLIARHPEHRRELHLGVFWKPTHATLVLALAGQVALRRHPVLAAALTLPYLSQYVDWRQLARPRGIARVAVNLAARVAVDSIELAVTAREAARNRVLVL